MPVAFIKIMNPAEYNYQIHNKEILAIVKSLEEWRPELYFVLLSNNVVA